MLKLALKLSYLLDEQVFFLFQKIFFRYSTRIPLKLIQKTSQYLMKHISVKIIVECNFHRDRLLQAFQLYHVIRVSYSPYCFYLAVS